MPEHEHRKTLKTRKQQREELEVATGESKPEKVNQEPEVEDHGNADNS